MNLGRFQAMLDAYGASPERWPEGRRADALVLARSSVEAARALAQARALDEALQAAEVPDIAAQPERFAVLHARIVAAARPIVRRGFGRLFDFELTPVQLWPSVAGLVLATMLGFAVGIGGLIEGYSQQDSDDATLTPPVDFIFDVADR